MKKRIKTPYFPQALIFSTPLFFICGVCLVINTYPLWGVVIFLLVTIILTTSYITEIDLRKKAYKDYLFFFGFDLQTEIRRFNKIDKIVITMGRHEHVGRFPGAEPYMVNWHQFTATILYDKDAALELATKKSKKELIKAIKDMATFLQVDVEDRCGREAYIIDMTRAR